MCFGGLLLDCVGVCVCVFSLYLASLCVVCCFAFLCSCWKDKDGNDLPLNTLRWCLQKAEADGMVDWQLGGHTAERPPQVYSGSQDDMLLGCLLIS